MTDNESLTYLDAVGAERWRDGDKLVNQNSPFRKAPSGFAIDVAKMAQNHRTAEIMSETIRKERARGHNRSLPSVSKNHKVGPALQEMVERQTTAYGRAKIPNKMKP